MAVTSHPHRGCLSNQAAPNFSELVSQEDLDTLLKEHELLGHNIYSQDKSGHYVITEKEDEAYSQLTLNGEFFYTLVNERLVDIYWYRAGGWEHHDRR